LTRGACDDAGICGCHANSPVLRHAEVTVVCGAP
jgi:hypothetical protein